MSKKNITQKMNLAPKGGSIQKRKQQVRPKQQLGLRRSQIPVATAIQVKTLSPKPFMRRNGDFVVTHRELIGGMANTLNVFQVIKRLRLNPGSLSTFTWLSSIATCFEKYRFEKLIFRYLPRASTNTQGSICMAPDYDAADGATSTSTEQQMVANQDAVEDAIYHEVALVCSPKRMNETYKAHYVMGDARFSTTDQDQKTIDVGQVFIGMDASNTNVQGKLWVEYTCVLLNPCNPTETPGSGARVASIALDGGASNPVKTTFGTAYNEPDPIGTASTTLSPDLFTFSKDWKGLLEHQYTGVGMTALPDARITRNGIPTTQTTLSNLLNGAGNVGFRTSGIAALAGDVLSIVGGNAGTFNGLNWQLAESNVAF